MININIDKCDIMINPNCKPKAEIEKFFHSFTLQVWTYNEHINYRKYFNKPTSMNQFYRESLYPGINLYSNST